MVTNQKGKGEQGLTILEVLIAITILFIVLFPLMNNITSVAIHSHEADTRLILMQEATKQLEAERQRFYDNFEFITFTNLNDKPLLHTYYVELDKTYYGEVRGEFVEQVGRYQLVKLTSIIGDVNGDDTPTEVSTYVTNR